MRGYPSGRSVRPRAALSAAASSPSGSPTRPSSLADSAARSPAPIAGPAGYPGGDQIGAADRERHESQLLDPAPGVVGSPQTHRPAPPPRPAPARRPPRSTKRRGHGAISAPAPARCGRSRRSGPGARRSNPSRPNNSARPASTDPLRRDRQHQRAGITGARPATRAHWRPVRSRRDRSRARSPRRAQTASVPPAPRLAPAQRPGAAARRRPVARRRSSGPRPTPPRSPTRRCPSRRRTRAARRSGRFAAAAWDRRAKLPGCSTRSRPASRSPQRPRRRQQLAPRGRRKAPTRSH